MTVYKFHFSFFNGCSLQTVDDARKLLKHIDPKLGEPLPEKDYGGACVIYDETNPDDPWHNVLDKMDGFVVVHFFGWWLKVMNELLTNQILIGDVWAVMAWHETLLNLMADQCHWKSANRQALVLQVKAGPVYVYYIFAIGPVYTYVYASCVLLGFLF